jgi:hypothetical protein
MKIRFYHFWVYRLFHWVWTPIFKERPDMHRAFVEHGQGWLGQRERLINERRASIHSVKSGDEDE